MKKIVALLIAVAVLCSVSVPAFAAYKDEYKLDVQGSSRHLRSPPSGFSVMARTLLGQYFTH